MVIRKEDRVSTVLEPPEPMVRTLAARGFEWEVREQSPELVRVFIRRADADPAEW